MTQLSISRAFARWTANLKYEDLPPAVVDKLKAIVLHALSSAVLGSDSPQALKTLALTLAEEGKADGATILVTGEQATRIGATFANSELMHASNLFDSYRMLTHPGPVLLPAALVNADLEGRTGKEIITALAAGYEFVCRLCDDFIPSTAARGFRPSPIYSTLGAALVSGKLQNLDENGLVTAISLAANFASGLNEGPRVGGNELYIHEPQAARNGVFAAVMARLGHIKGSELTLEGDAGFYNAFTGSSKGKLTYAFKESLQIDFASVTKNLGQEFKLLTVMFRMYACPGYNQPVIELMAEMKKKYTLSANDIQEVAVSMNWLETLYPSPEFPRFADYQTPRIGETHYFVAHAAVNGGVPVVGGQTYGPTGHDLAQDQVVLTFMRERVKLVPEKQRPMFSPGITVTMKNGQTFSDEYPYSRMEWNFAQLIERLKECFPEKGAKQRCFDQLIKVIEQLEQADSVSPLFQATYIARGA